MRGIRVRVRVLQGLLVAIALGASTPAMAVELLQGQSVKITFSVAKASAWDFVPITLTFGADDPFGANEVLSFKTFNSANQLVNSDTTPSGSAIYSGSNTLLEFGNSFFVPISTKTFTMVVTADQGSFNLTGATADLQYALLSPTVTYKNVVGTFGSVTGIPTAAVPEPATWGVMLLGFGGTGYALRRRRTAGRVPTV